MHQFKELTVWQKAVDLATKVYQYTQQFPSEEKFGLTSQIRRSVVSISSNIAEGAGRKSKKEFKQFFEYSLWLSLRIGNSTINSSKFKFSRKNHYEMLSESISEIQKMIYSLSKSLK